MKIWETKLFGYTFYMCFTDKEKIHYTTCVISLWVAHKDGTQEMLRRFGIADPSNVQINHMIELFQYDMKQFLKQHKREIADFLIQNHFCY